MSTRNPDRMAALRTILEITDAALQAHPEEIDNLVNLVVSEDLGPVPMSEVMRVLAQSGVAYVKTGDTWTKTVKPRPAAIDEWTHWLRAADGNAVAADTVVGPPRHAQWLAFAYRNIGTLFAPLSGRPEQRQRCWIDDTDKQRALCVRPIGESINIVERARE